MQCGDLSSASERAAHDVAQRPLILRREAGQRLGRLAQARAQRVADLRPALGHHRKIAQFLNREDAMLFNSGFGGALGTISGLLRKTDVAVLDNRSHLSLRDGATLSRCRSEKFEHNDPASLDASLGRHQGKRQLVVIEGIYSMDGDFGNLPELIATAESHGASVFIDEAHSILACGEHGRGAAEKFGVEDRVPLTYGTFSKAFGALGGFIAGSRETLQYLRFYAHPYVYSCALPAVVVAYHVTYDGHPDSYPLHIASKVLSDGQSSRIYRKLVYDTGLALTALRRLGTREELDRV